MMNCNTHTQTHKHTNTHTHTHVTWDFEVKYGPTNLVVPCHMNSIAPQAALVGFGFIGVMFTTTS